MTEMANAGGHRDRSYAKWWVILGVVLAVSLVLIYIGPFASSQPNDILQSPPTSITEADQATDNNTEPQESMSDQTKNVSLAEESPSRGAEKVAPEPMQ
jgi:hypothetical protein